MSDHPDTVRVIELDELPGRERARRFEGAEHGAQASMFIMEYVEGEGADLHRHPYEETFVIRSGAARFTVGERTVEARGGQIVIVPPNTWHGFRATGPEKLVQVSVHPVERMVQENLEEE